MKKNKLFILLVISVLLGLIPTSCKDYLDVVPDNIPTIDQAFNNRNEAENYLFGCFSFIPSHADINANPALTGGDEVWLIDNIYHQGSPLLWKIAKGEQGTNSPLANYWCSNQDDPEGGKRLFVGIRDCNIFLEQIDKPFDLEDWERNQWVAEAKFVKAYLHYWLFRMYGPIPLIKENLLIGSSSEEVRIHREPVDEVVDYIVSLLDECAKDLPIEVMASDMGRPTKQIALALKAQVLTLAASPLFNGNSDYANMIDNRGINLFPQEYKAEKWQRAADALRAAIDTCHNAGHTLFDFHESPNAGNLNESTILAMQVRGAVTERWNKEIIWGDPNSRTVTLQELCHPAFSNLHSSGQILPCYAPPLRVVEQFYSRNGVPIDEDTEWDGVDKFGLRVGDDDSKYLIKNGYTTINLHFNREARFYSSISFDGGVFYGNGSINSDNNLSTVELIYGRSTFYFDRYSPTGYLVKKLINLYTSIPNAQTFTEYRYAFPVIRLADLYLMYAEALNEWKPAPDGEVYEYINYVRARTGLEGVVESWSKYSKIPNKPLTKEGMREIIRRERLNELAFEGSRFWDLRRWKMAEEFMNQPVRGLNILEDEPSEFYKIQNVFDLTFDKKDYLWPIKQGELVRNSNLIQNPGW